MAKDRDKFKSALSGLREKSEQLEGKLTGENPKTETVVTVEPEIIDTPSPSPIIDRLEGLSKNLIRLSKPNPKYEKVPRTSMVIPTDVSTSYSQLALALGTDKSTLVMNILTDFYNKNFKEINQAIMKNQPRAL